jgi:hypothetical protein
MKTLSDYYKSEVVSLFPTLDPNRLYWDDLENGYFSYNISQFDHFLNTQEAEDSTIYFDLKMEGKQKEKYFVLENLFLSAFKFLRNSEQIVFVVYDDDFEKFNLNIQVEGDQLLEKVRMIEFENDFEFEKVLLNGLREIEGFVILVPKFKAILISDYDLEIVLFAVTEADANILFDKYFRNNGFFLLKH